MRRYIQLLELWWMQTDLSEAQTGAAIAGRLRGTAFQHAMSLEAVRIDTATNLPKVVRAPALFAEPAYDGGVDAHGVTHAAYPGGPQ